jgi:AcrR family transcriptional regulator
VTTLTPAAERLLTAAGQLFYDRGIHAVGVDLIAEVAGTTKKTLYDRFGSKDNLVALYLSRRLARWDAFVTERLAAHQPGEARILATFDVLAEWLAENRWGCAFVNANAEIGRDQHPGIPVIREDKQRMRALYQRLAAEAGATDPEALGARLHLLYEGALVAHTSGGQHDAVSHAKAAAMDLLAAAR